MSKTRLCLTADEQIRIAALNGAIQYYSGIASINPLSIAKLAEYYTKYIQTGEVLN